jgi:hypothetical protein
MVSAEEGEKLASLEFIDISNNLLGHDFIMIARQLKESCDFLQTFICCNNPGVKKTSSMVIPRSKSQPDAASMLLRLDLTNCLRGDE